MAYKTNNPSDSVVNHEVIIKTKAYIDHIVEYENQALREGWCKDTLALKKDVERLCNKRKLYRKTKGQDFELKGDDKKYTKLVKVIEDVRSLVEQYPNNVIYTFSEAQYNLKLSSPLFNLVVPNLVAVMPRQSHAYIQRTKTDQNNNTANGQEGETVAVKRRKRPTKAERKRRQQQGEELSGDIIDFLIKKPTPLEHKVSPAGSSLPGATLLPGLDNIRAERQALGSRFIAANQGMGKIDFKRKFHEGHKSSLIRAGAYDKKTFLQKSSSFSKRHMDGMSPRLRSYILEDSDSKSMGR